MINTRHQYDESTQLEATDEVTLRSEPVRIRKTRKPRSPLKRLTSAYQVIVDHLAELGLQDEATLANYEDTASRAAKALMEMTQSHASIHSEIEAIINKQFPTDDGSDRYASSRKPGMIVQGPIDIISMCPHHLMPIKYEAFVAYIPNSGKVLGLSKLTRIARQLGKRPILQETLGEDIADVLFKGERTDLRFPSLDSQGSAVYLRGVHGCMSNRGVRCAAATVTVTVRGSMYDLEERFLTHVRLGLSR